MAWCVALLVDVGPLESTFVSRRACGQELSRTGGANDKLLDGLLKLYRVGDGFSDFQMKYRFLAPAPAAEFGQAASPKTPPPSKAAGERGNAAVESLLRELKKPNTPPEMQPTRLSWRVHLLPFIGREELFKKFRLNEPWDSPHNKPLLNEMPEEYRWGETTGSVTRFQVIRGRDMLFGGTEPPRDTDATDGRRQTILVLIVGPEKAVPWTKPDDVTIDPQAPLQSIGASRTEPILCLTVNGDWLVLPPTIEPREFLAICTPRGNEIVDADIYRRQFEKSHRNTPRNLLNRYVPERRESKNRKTPTAPETPAAFSADRVVAFQRADKLRDLGIAMHSHHDNFTRFPITENRRYFAPNGKPYLSWRVHLLPFLDQKPLFERFKLDEPWDSPHNQKLLAHMPDAYRDPLDLPRSTTTRYMTITGPETAFREQFGPQIRSLVDGPGRTILIVRAGQDKAVPWTKPVDLEFDASDPLRCLGDLKTESLGCLFADGRVMNLKPTIPAKIFKGLVTRWGSEPPAQLDEFQAP